MESLLAADGFISKLFYGMSLMPWEQSHCCMENIMRTFKVSDDLYDQLKSLVVDPFDDTPEIVITRLIEIVNKAKSRWSSFEEDIAEPAEPARRRQEFHEQEQVVVL